MHCTKTRALTAALALAMSAGSAGAASYGAFEPRSLGMGGAGVAAGTSANAVFLNPALLAIKGRERFDLSLPIGGRMSDPNELIDAADDFSDAAPISAFQSAIAQYRLVQNEANAQGVIDSGTALIGQLRNLSDKSLQGEGMAALVVGVPGERFGVSAFASGYAVGGAVGRLSDGDLTAIEAVIDAAGGLAPVTDPTPDLQSSVQARFAAIGEAGVSIATRLEAFGGISVGVTPKYVHVRTYDYSFVGDELDDADIELEDGERTESNFNVDLGLAKDWGNGWVTGLSVRNLVAREYRTVRDNVVKIEPQARIGVARRGERLTVAADIDLNEREPVGFESRSRYAIVGAEYDLFRTVQLRAGYRHNLSSLPAGQEAGTVSLGLGLSPFGVCVDMAVSGNSDEVGAALRLGFRF